MSFLTFSHEAGVGTVSIDRPPANALNAELIGELGTILDAVIADPAVRCLVIASANPRFFMAGGDINKYAVLAPDELVALVASYRATFQRLRGLRVPTIVVVDGHAQGGGAEMLLACDFRIIGSDAKIGFPEILLGGVPSAGGTQWLPPLVGYDRALELMLTGRTIEHEEAMHLGLATRHADDPLAEALRFAEQIAALPPVAVAHIKRCAGATLAGDPEKGAAREDEATAAIGVTEEFRERVQAFLSRRRERGKVAS
ncbi:MAG TPA: enoyl-CoA hydratase/isomerase family protein [Solirubrobacteraceae bacterium]|nr:enoyl-CoA hydratase/isomerase family protein [Solirubrobacteraceae bacterium]